MGDSIAIVTGANRGLGRETAAGLARNGMTVILACRNISEAERVRAEIVQSTENPNIFVMSLDLSSRASILCFVEQFKTRIGRLNVLVNNAGISSQKKGTTSDGLEINIGTNYFGTFLLTYSLLPFFEKDADNRIINSTSEIYRFGFFNLNRINNYRWVKAYAVSKYMVLLFSLELAEYVEPLGIKVNAVHPGIVRTSIMFTKKWYDAIINTLLLPYFIDVKEGARPNIFLATSDELKTTSGKYFNKCRQEDIPKRYNNLALRKKLFQYSLEYAREKA
jgi:NAD(P)-dependent dehydrogenase (short-subunit alcohol dehydrogenase family)